MPEQNRAVTRSIGVSTQKALTRFGRSIAFYPLVDLLRREFGIEDDDPEDAVVDKIEHGMRVAGDDASVGLPFVRHLLGAGPMEAAVSQMDPQERRGELFQALRRYFLPTSERKPRVLVYEDIHWVDGATEEWLATMMDSVPTSRTLHILTHRTDYVHPFGERSYYTRVGVGALSSADSLVVARAMLGGEDLPSAVREAITGQSDGNPFFVEEIVKSLQEGPGGQRPGDLAGRGHRGADRPRRRSPNHGACQ